MSQLSHIFEYVAQMELSSPKLPSIVLFIVNLFDYCGKITFQLHPPAFQISIEQQISIVWESTSKKLNIARVGLSIYTVVWWTEKGKLIN